MASKAMVLIFSAFLALILAGCEQKGGMDNIAQILEQNSVLNKTVIPVIKQTRLVLGDASLKFEETVAKTKQKVQAFLDKISAYTSAVQAINKPDAFKLPDALKFKAPASSISETAGPAKPLRQVVEPHDGIA